MSASIRFVTTVALSAALASAPAVPAFAQTPAEQANRLNDEGKQLFAEKDFDGAYEKFRAAAALSPEARFYYNQCYALGFLERYEEAIQKCEQVEPAGADAALLKKTENALASLRQKVAAKQGGEARPVPAGDVRDGVDDPTGPGPSGPPPAPQSDGPDPFISARSAGPVDAYTWSIGGTLGGLANLNTGREVDNSQGLDQEMFGPGGAELRLFANFIVSQPARIGLQGSLGVSALAPGENNDEDNNLLLADIGGALFVHLPLFRHLYVTPLAGPQISVQQPNELSQGFVAFGARGELGFTYVFGRRGEHSFSVVPAINVYFPAGGEVEGLEPDEYGLDETHATFGVSAGYAFRFSTPFGTVPLITLE
jgi:hypothetical protein